MVSKILKKIGKLIWASLLLIMFCEIILTVLLYTPFFLDNNSTPELRPYFHTFIERCAVYKVDCSKLKEHTMKIGRIPWYVKLFGEVIGVCKPGWNQVILDEHYWAISSRIEREMLVFHELGHCVLDKDHIDGRFIMNPTILSPGVYINFYQKFNDTFFGCQKSCPEVKFKQETY